MTGLGDRNVALDESDAAPIIDNRMRNGTFEIFILGAFVDMLVVEIVV